MIHNLIVPIGLAAGIATILAALYCPLPAPKPRPRLDRALGIDQPGDQPGQFLTSLDGHNDAAIAAGLVDELLPLRQAAPGALTADEQALWSDIEAHIHTPYHVPFQRTEQL